MSTTWADVEYEEGMDRLREQLRHDEGFIEELKEDLRADFDLERLQPYYHDYGACWMLLVERSTAHDRTVVRLNLAGATEELRQ